MKVQVGKTYRIKDEFKIRMHSIIGDIKVLQVNDAFSTQATGYVYDVEVSRKRWNWFNSTEEVKTNTELWIEQDILNWCYVVEDSHPTKPNCNHNWKSEYYFSKIPYTTCTKCGAKKEES